MPEESTPLLPQLELITPQVDRLLAVERLTDLPIEGSNNHAFLLVVLLQYLQSTTKTTARSAEIWDTYNNERDRDYNHALIGQRIDEIWSRFLSEFRGRHEIENVLWREYPLDESGKTAVRVVDYLLQSSAPHSFLTHPVVMASLEQTWKYGRSRAPNSQQTVSSKYDALATPRVLHFIALSIHLGYLFILGRFLLCGDFPIWQKYLVLSYSLPSIFATATSLRVLPFILVLLSFTFDIPTPGTTSFTAVLLAFNLHLYSIHLPSSPSLIFLFSSQKALPLVTIFKEGIAQVFAPALLFFAPSMLLLSILLSISMAGTLPQLAYLLQFSQSEVAPMETRVGFLLSFTVTFLFLCLSVFILSAAFRPQQNAQPWDRYSHSSGITARRTFIQLLLKFPPYTFPPPFNALHIFIQPLGIIFPSTLSSTKITVWRWCVGPLCVFGAALMWLAS